MVRSKIMNNTDWAWDVVSLRLHWYNKAIVYFFKF